MTGTEYLDCLIGPCKNCGADVMEPCRDLDLGMVHIARMLAALRAQQDTTPR